MHKKYPYKSGVLTSLPWVQIPPLGPKNDNPNYMIRVGCVFGFIIFY